MSGLSILSADAVHGREPFEGGRRALQVAWVEGAVARERRRMRNRIAPSLEGIVGR